MLLYFFIFSACLSYSTLYGRVSDFPGGFYPKQILVKELSFFTLLYM